MKKQKVIESVWLAKTLSVVLAVLILVAMCLIPTSAVELTADGASASTVSHSVNAEFTAAIPAYVMPGEPGEASADYTVTLENAVIPDNHELTAKVEYSGSMTEQNGVELPYVLLDESGVKIASGSKILTKAAGAPGESVSVSFGAALTAKARYAGVYTDTAMFTFDVKEKAYTLDEINADAHLYAIGLTKPEYVLAEFNADYTSVQIFKNGSDSDGVMKAFDYKSQSPMAKHWTTLLTATIQSGVVNVGDSAFSDCYSLESVAFPQTLTTIGKSAFFNCEGLKKFHIPTAVNEIGSCAFTGCTSIESVDISAKYIWNSAFSECTNLKEITLRDGVQIIGESAFSKCGVESIDIPDSVTDLRKGAFQDCLSLKTASVLMSATSIPDDAFWECTALQSVLIGDEIKIIGKSAFYGCEVLETVDIGAGLERINSSAFYECRILKDVTIRSNRMSDLPYSSAIGERAFAYTPDFTVYGISGSYMEQWAANSNHPFVAL